VNARDLRLAIPRRIDCRRLPAGRHTCHSLSRRSSKSVCALVYPEQGLTLAMNLLGMGVTGVTGVIRSTRSAACRRHACVTASHLADCTV
jgi:hypothetical protein